MFKIVSKHLFWWPVTVKTPSSAEPGTFVEDTFRMQFEALPMDRAREIDAARAKLSPEERDRRSFDFVFEVAKGWDNVVDEAGQSLAFTREVFEAALQNAWFRDAVLSAYQSAMAGQEARLGN